MTDHLKQATGSLGGDQDEKLRWKVLNGSLWQLENGQWHEHACSQLARDIAEDYESAIAALAQKTRECEELRKDDADAKINYQRWRDCEAERDALKAQVEQLGRQVAEMSKPVTDEEWRDYVGVLDVPDQDSWETHAIDELAERTEINALLASRAHTK